jgi:hypothetical protein
MVKSIFDSRTNGSRYWIGIDIMQPKGNMIVDMVVEQLKLQ